MQTSSEPIAEPPANPNCISMFDDETQSGNEHEPNENVNDDVHINAQPSNDNDVEIEPAVDLDNPQSKNQRYDKRDFVARKQGKEREPWAHKPMPFPPKPSKKKDEEDFEHFPEMIRPIFLCMRDAQPSNDNDFRSEPAVDLDNPQSKNQRYDKRDFVAKKHGKEREPWVHKPMPFPPKPSKKRMMTILSALLKCLDLSFCVCV